MLYTNEFTFSSKSRPTFRGPVHRPPNVPTYTHYEEYYNLQEKPTPAPARLTTARIISLPLISPRSVRFLLLAFRVLSRSIFVRRRYRYYVVIIAELACFRAESEVANSG